MFGMSEHSSVACIADTISHPHAAQIRVDPHRGSVLLRLSSAKRVAQALPQLRVPGGALLWARLERENRRVAEASDQQKPPLEMLSNMSRYHRERKKFYSQAPLRQAVDIHASSRALKPCWPRGGAKRRRASTPSPTRWPGRMWIERVRQLQSSA